MKKTMIALLLAAVVLGLLTAQPILSCTFELPEAYRQAIQDQAKGRYSVRLPLVPVFVKTERFEEERVYYTIYYFPLGSVGMSYHPEDGYNIEKTLSRI